jgi:hypothetical protein
MAGLLGSMVAGAAKSVADGRLKDIEQKEKFDYQNALLNAQAEKELMLKKAGIEMEDARDQGKKDKVAAIAGSVKDPMEGKGGYESEEDASKRNRGLLQQRADKLADAGEYDAAKAYYSRADAYDKTELSKAQLEAKLTQIEGTIANGQERLRLQGEANTAKAEAAAAKASKGSDYKPTDSDKGYQSYVQQMKEQGKKPMARYQFENWLESKQASFKQGETESVTTKTIDNQTGAETSVTTKGRQKPKSADDKDPLGLFRE